MDKLKTRSLYALIQTLHHNSSPSCHGPSS
jgi:hypothetical protein